MPTFEEAIVAAIANSFFEPQPYMTTPFDGSPPHLAYTPSQASNLASTLFQQKREEILAAVTAALDIEALGQKIADQLVRNLTSKSWSESYQGDQFRRDLRAAVIDKVAAIKAAELVEAE